MTYHQLLNSFYNLIRPLFVKNLDENEDFLCCYCNKPILNRDLFCSERCQMWFNIEFQ